MIKKLTGLVVVAAFFAVATPNLSGCSKKVNCKTVCEKMKKCSGAFAEVAGKGMPKAAQDMMKKEMKKQFGDVDKCTKDCKKNKKDKDDAAMKKCMAKSDCKAFAKCVIESGKKKNS